MSIRLSVLALSLSCLLVLHGCAPSAQPASVLYSGYPNKGAVSRIYADGRLESIDLGATRADGGSIVYGTDYPLPSPDGKHIAFVRGNDVWLMDLKEREARPITQTEAEKVKVSGAYLTSWSFDGGKLLFYVAPALPDDASQHQLIMEMINPALSNWRVYDLTTGKTEMLSLPARFVAWLPDGDFLLIPNGEKAWQPILRWRPGSASPSEFVTEKADYGQFSLSSDGKAILGLAAFDDRTFSIVSIDTQTGSLQRVIGPGKFAQYNRPAASPRAKRLAYLERRGKETTLVSNGIAMPLALVGWPSFHWINDQTIAALDKCKLAILDVKSRRVIAQHPVKLHANEDRDKVCQP